MKALVCISRTPDTTAKIAFTETKQSFNETDIQWIVNPYDEWYALGKALDLKQEGKLTQVDLLMVGNAAAEVVLRKAIALGGDEVFRIDDNPNDSLSTAKLIVAFLKDKNYRLILGGKETIDYNAGSVMPMVAALLKLPFIGQIHQLDIKDDTLLFTHRILGKTQQGELKNTNAVCSCQKGLSHQKLPNMKGVMAARTKKIEVLSYPKATAHTTIQSMSVLLKDKHTQWIDPTQPKEVLQILKNKHKLDINV